MHERKDRKAAALDFEPQADAALDVAGLTDTGRARSGNEDSWAALDVHEPARTIGSVLGADDREFAAPSATVMLAVADGLGGHAGGEQASGAAISRLVQIVRTHPDDVALSGDDHEVEAALRGVVAHCGDAVAEAAAASAGAQNMGTTLTTAWITRDELIVAHAGDSRCYLVRDGAARRVTTDHTVANQLVSEGTLTEDQAETSPLSHVLWNALGPTMDTHVDVYRVPLRPGDQVLVCSDGLTRHVDEGTIAAVVASLATAKEACAELVRRANAGGGSDNITCVVARVPAAARVGIGRMIRRATRRFGLGRRADDGASFEGPSASLFVLPALAASQAAGGGASLSPAAWAALGGLAVAAALVFALKGGSERAHTDRPEPASDEDVHAPLAAVREVAPPSCDEARQWLEKLRADWRDMEPLLTVPAVQNDPRLQHRVSVFEERLQTATSWLAAAEHFSPDVWAQLREGLTHAFENLREEVQLKPGAATAAEKTAEEEGLGGA